MDSRLLFGWIALGVTFIGIILLLLFWFYLMHFGRMKSLWKRYFRWKYDRCFNCNRIIFPKFESTHAGTCNKCFYEEKCKQSLEKFQPKCYYDQGLEVKKGDVLTLQIIMDDDTKKELNNIYLQAQDLNTGKIKTIQLKAVKVDSDGKL